MYTLLEVSVGLPNIIWHTSASTTKVQLGYLKLAHLFRPLIFLLAFLILLTHCALLRMLMPMVIYL